MEEKTTPLDNHFRNKLWNLVVWISKSLRLKRIKRILFAYFAYNSFLRETVGLIPWFLFITYPFYGTIFVMLFIFLVHPATFFIPLIPPISLYLKEIKRRSEIQLHRTDGIDLSSERQMKAIDDFVAMVNKKRGELED